MKSIVRTLVPVWALLFVLEGSPARAEGPQVYKLGNGLTVLLAPDSLASAVDVAVWYRAGVRTEPAGRSGITHLMERLMFRGTRTTPSGDFRRLLAAEGAAVNSYTTTDYTSFFETLPPAAVDLALRLEADRMANLAIDSTAVGEERAYALRERRTLVDGNPVARATERLYATAFPGDGYGRSVLGTAEDLGRITTSDLAAYHRARYGPGGSLLTVVGNFDPAQVSESVKRHFGVVPARSTAAARPVRLPAPLARGKSLAGPATIAAVGWRTPADAGLPGIPLELLSGIVSEATDSRIQTDLVTPAKLIYQARTSFDSQKDGSLFYLLAAARPGADSSAVEHALTAEVEKLASEPVSVDELDRARRGYLAAWYQDQQSVRSRARVLGSAQLLRGDYHAAQADLDALRQLTPADLLATAKRVFRPEARSVIWMMAQSGGTGGRP